MAEKKETIVKETITKETVVYDGQEYTYVLREVSKQQILEVSAEDLSDFPLSNIIKLFIKEINGQSPEQVDLRTQYDVYLHARKHIWSTLKKVVFAGITLAEFSDTPFGQFIFDLFIDVISGRLLPIGGGGGPDPEMVKRIDELEQRIKKLENANSFTDSNIST